MSDSSKLASARPPRAVEDCIKAMYALAERGAPVTTTSLAVALTVTPSTVSAMLARLREMSLISHRPYAEVKLTEAGLQLALSVIRRRRLIESFLIDTLDYRWDEVEREAEILGQAASDLFIERIAEKLNHPSFDPHGDPIPGPDGSLPPAASQVLSSLLPGESGRLVRVWNGDPDVLRYLDGCQIRLGDRMQLLRREPFGGPLLVRVGEDEPERLHGFGEQLAEMLSVELES